MTFRVLPNLSFKKFYYKEYHALNIMLDAIIKLNIANTSLHAAICVRISPCNFKLHPF